MPLSLQSKLLRVLQDGEIRPVGGTTAIKVDVRIVSATHQDLREQIEAGKFRQDLFYRLDVIPVHIPPLRSRPEDIMRLAQLFLERHAPGERRTISDGAMRALSRCIWEGNARELENVIERSLAVSDKSELEPGDLLLPSGEAHASRSEAAQDPLGFAVSAQLTLRELQGLYTQRVLLQTNGNKLQAAKLLGINRRTLYRRGEA
jgi:transcriptional regulator with PAS, ATPase and Fis domain